MNSLGQIIYVCACVHVEIHLQMLARQSDVIRSMNASNFKMCKSRSLAEACILMRPNKIYHSDKFSTGFFCPDFFSFSLLSNTKDLKI